MFVRLSFDIVCIMMMLLNLVVCGSYECLVNGWYVLLIMIRLWCVAVMICLMLVLLYSVLVGLFGYVR